MTQVPHLSIPKQSAKLRSTSLPITPRHTKNLLVAAIFFLRNNSTALAASCPHALIACFQLHPVSRELLISSFSFMLYASRCGPDTNSRLLNAFLIGFYSFKAQSLILTAYLLLALFYGRLTIQLCNFTILLIFIFVSLARRKSA